MAYDWCFKKTRAEIERAIVSGVNLPRMVDVEAYLIIQDGFTQKEKYDRYLKTRHWFFLSKKKKKSVGNKCERCGVVETKINYLDTHHVNYKNLLDVELSDLEVLCRKCHIEHHKK